MATLSSAGLACLVGLAGRGRRPVVATTERAA